MKTKIFLVLAMVTAGALVYAADTKAVAKNATQTAITWERGTGQPNPDGHKRNFVDTNNDGICDTFADTNKDGKCDKFVDNNKDGYNDNSKHFGKGKHGNRQGCKGKR